MDDILELDILNFWNSNCQQWTSAVREELIKSRLLVTNKAITDAVLCYSPQSVLDIGCGEGWLIRQLSHKVKHLVGIDAVQGLIEAARVSGGGDFHAETYKDFLNRRHTSTFDAIVCNFSLFGNESVNALFSDFSRYLTSKGVVIVQTLHPTQACENTPYLTGWRQGQWTSFDANFVDPAPWYFRTLENWTNLFLSNGFSLLEIREPLHPETQKPASIIFIGSVLNR